MAKKPTKRIVKKQTKRKAKKVVRKKAAAPLRRNLIGFRAVCSERDWRSGRVHATEQEAIEYGMARHGDRFDHAIETEETQRR